MVEWVVVFGDLVIIVFVVVVVVFVVGEVSRCDVEVVLVVGLVSVCVEKINPSESASFASAIYGIETKATTKYAKDHAMVSSLRAALRGLNHNREKDTKIHGTKMARKVQSQ